MAKRKPKPVEKPSLVATLSAEQQERIADALKPDAFIALLRGKRMTTRQLCEKTGGDEQQVMDAIYHCQGKGYLLNLFGDQWELSKAPAASDKRDVYKSRPDGTYLFGFSSDQHLCSKYERLDVLNSLYDHFAEQGVDRVFNAGNWIDGEARFNKHDLKVHGLDPQLDYLVDNYPQRKGIVTYAIAGDDHEGWYGQREGIDIGAYAQDKMRKAGRTDWVHCGYMEAFTALEHAKTGATAYHLNMHPGGGSSYAVSYRPQKIIESLAGGEKPAILGIGHYHKMSFNSFRNVWVYQAGTTQDQTIFMRKKSLEAHVGGGSIKATQDQDSGAIVACRIEFFQYFNRGHYDGRWSNSGEVSLVPRGAA